MGEKDSERWLEVLGAQLLGRARRFSAPEVVEAAGVERELADRLWRAMGFPALPDDERDLTQDDLDALRRTVALVDYGLAGPDEVVQVARTFGQATARIAQTLIAALTEWIDTEGTERLDARPEPPASLVAAVLPDLDHLVVYLFHRHLLDTVQRWTQADGDARSVVVGFADLVGYTRLTGELSESGIAEVIDRFEATTSDVIVNGGGRIIKMIGDEVMFVVAGAEASAVVALDLLERLAGEDRMPEVRVGLAEGPVVERRGDVYGPVVNLAARAVTLANPGTVLASFAGEVRLAEGSTIILKHLRPHRLKGIGPVRLTSVRRR